MTVRNLTVVNMSFYLDFASLDVCKHYCTLCNNESSQPPNMILYVLTYQNKTSKRILRYFLKK